jgi:hypothetical protein
MLILDWVVFTIMLVNMILSRVFKRLDLVQPTLIVMILKHYYLTIDTSGMKKAIEEGESHFMIAY